MVFGYNRLCKLIICKNAVKFKIWNLWVLEQVCLAKFVIDNYFNRFADKNSNLTDYEINGIFEFDNVGGCRLWLI